MALAVVNGTRLWYETVGEGPLLLCMHGGLGPDHSGFRPWLDPLGESMKVAFYDHRGGGRSERPPSLDDVTHDTFARDADELREHLGYDRMVLLGHSYGGMLALEYALRFPDRLAGLVLSCTSPAWDFTDTIDANARERGPESAAVAHQRMASEPVEDDALLAELWMAIQPLYYHRWDPRYLEHRSSDPERFSAAAYDRSEVLLDGWSVVDQIGRIEVPTLVIGGRHDWVTPPEQSERSHALIPGAELVIFEMSGHYPFVEEQDGYLSAVADFVSRVQ